MSDELNKELLKKANQLMRTATQSLADLQLVLDELGGKETKRIKERDENDEPTWSYAIKVKIPPDFYLTRKFLDYAMEYGFSVDEATQLMLGKPSGGYAIYEGFFKYYNRVGTKWQNWTLVWQKWVRTEHDRRQAKKNGSSQTTRFDAQRTRA